MKVKELRACAKCEWRLEDGLWLPDAWLKEGREGGREVGGRAAGQFDELTYADGRLHWMRSRVGEREGREREEGRVE